MKKLAITEEREEDKYDHLTTVKCWTCDPQIGVEIPNAPNDPKVLCCLLYIRIVFYNQKKKLPIILNR